MIFKSCELELPVTVKAEAKGGFRFWVVDASGKLAGETVHNEVDPDRETAGAVF
jgi:hypothetical protein